jgi:endonuclease III
MAHTEESISKELARISAGIPENLQKNVVREVPATPTMEMVMRKALEMESISKEKRDQIKTLLDNGDFSKKKAVENPRIAKMIDNYVGREINKSIKSGKLPSRSVLRNMPHHKKYIHE